VWLKQGLKGLVSHEKYPPTCKGLLEEEGSTLQPPGGEKVLGTELDTPFKGRGNAALGNLQIMGGKVMSPCQEAGGLNSLLMRVAWGSNESRGIH